MDKLQQLKKIIHENDNIVFFGGAGVSTESGIPDFRSPDGLYSQQYKYIPEIMVSHSFYTGHAEEFFEFYKDRMINTQAQPNDAHLKLAELEKRGKVRAVITQNIDGLHQMAGSTNVLELHGSIHRNYCEKCKTFYGLDYILRSKGVPKCVCGGTVKPDVVLYEEKLDNDIVSKSIKYIRNAKVLIIGGTSLAVYPAAGLIDYFKGNYLIVINNAPTSRDKEATLLFKEKIGEIFNKL